jgi:solute carrier family 35 protein F1/2
MVAMSALPAATSPTKNSTRNDEVLSLSPRNNNSDKSPPCTPKSSSLREHDDSDDIDLSVHSYADEIQQRTNGKSHHTMREMAFNFVFGNCKALLFGQFLSLFLAGNGAIQSSLYLDCRLSAPSFSMLTFYFPLCIITLSQLVYQARRNALNPSVVATDENEQVECRTCKALQSKQNTALKTRLRRRIRPKLEKRNHLLSHWSTQLDDTFDNDAREGSDDLFFSDDDDDAGYAMVATNDNNKTTTTCRECYERRRTATTSHSLLGIIPLKCNPLRYAAVAVTDVYANYTTILALKYTTLTSVSLFDALAIPSAIIVSRFAFARRYTKIHMFGVIVCSIGIIINALQDYREDEELEKTDDSLKTDEEELIEADYPHKMLGDTLAIIGGLLFGLDNTLQEVAVRDWGTQLEYLGCMTFFATIISFMQAVISERDEILAFFQQSDTEACPENVNLLLLFTFSVVGMLNYLGVSSFLRISDSAFLNLSLLTGDAWAVLWSIYMENIYPPGSFYVALVITVAGVFIYETAPSPVADSKEEEGSEIIVGEIQLVENGNKERETTNPIRGSPMAQEGRYV